jgi:kynurenine formamidase
MQPMRVAAVLRLPGIRLCSAAAIVLSAAACQASPPAERAASGGAPAPVAAIGEARPIDLTHLLSPESLYWPTGAPFEHTRVAWGWTEAGHWYAAAAFASPEHLGTHLDAPIHFAEHGWTSADIPVERFFARGVVIDITARARATPDATLEPADVQRWEQEHGAVPPDSIVLVRTGWSGHWPDWERYYGSTTPKDVGTLRFPGVSADGARALVERRVAGVGIDTASIDPGVSRTFEAHQILAAANIFNLENLTGLEALPDTGFLVVALPMKIAGGTGGPTRVVALVPGR